MIEYAPWAFFIGVSIGVVGWLAFGNKIKFYYRLRRDSPERFKKRAAKLGYDVVSDELIEVEIERASGERLRSVLREIGYTDGEKDLIGWAESLPLYEGDKIHFLDGREATAHVYDDDETWIEGAD